MGCLPSKESQLDQLLVQAVKTIKVKPRKRPGKLNELLLKLPVLARGFKEMKAMFKKLDTNHTGKLNAQQVQDNAEMLGFEKNDENLHTILVDTKLAKASAITVEDFIVLLTVVHLRFPDGHMMKVHPDVGNTLSILEEFFVCFDATKDGCLERKEIEAVADAENSRHAGKKLFDQLDWDGNGSISFREFILGLQRFADDGDDEDEDTPTV